MFVKQLNVNEMSILEMLGIKSIDETYNYYSSKSDDEILHDIKVSLREAGVYEGGPIYDKIVKRYKEEASDNN